MFNTTLEMMDEAKKYIEATQETTYRVQTLKGDAAYWASITLDLRTKEANPQAGSQVREVINNQVLAKVSSLL